MKKDHSFFDFSGYADRYDGNVGTSSWYDNPDPDSGFDDDGMYVGSGKKKKKKKKRKKTRLDDYDSYGGPDDFYF